MIGTSKHVTIYLSVEPRWLWRLVRWIGFLSWDVYVNGHHQKMDAAALHTDSGRLALQYRI